MKDEIYKKELQKMLWATLENPIMPKIKIPKLKWYQRILQFLHIKDYRIIEYPKIGKIKVGERPTIKGGEKENE